MKICSICKKPIINQYRSTKYHGDCSNLSKKIIQKRWYEDNKTRHKQKMYIWVENNKEQHQIYQKEYRLKNKEKFKELHRRWILQNPQKSSEYSKKYRKNHPENAKNYYYQHKPQIRKIQHKYWKKRIKKDLNFKITNRLRLLMWSALRRYTTNGKVKPSKKYGIDYQAIIEHLKPFPENIKEYHIDHIRPLCSFNLENSEQVKQAFAPENHQWLIADENFKKGGKFEN